MTTPRRILVIGATGAMGQYLVPELSRMGFVVEALALDQPRQQLPNVTYHQANFSKPDVRDHFLASHYDAIVDFMTYGSASLDTALPRLLDATDQYIFLSSCRVFDNRQVPIVESSPRLLDSSDDPQLLASDDYCIYKARGENFLRAQPRRNWTIVRPSTTYSFMRYQLVTLEAPDTVGRAFRNKAVVVPVQAYSIPCSMTWGGDVGPMIARLVCNEGALGEDFNVTSSESHPWSVVADYFRDICGLRAVWVDQQDYLDILEPDRSRQNGKRWQLIYARLFNRVYDNTKMLQATGLEQRNFRSLYDGLHNEITRCPKDHPFPNNPRMDDYLRRLGENC